MSKKFRFPIVPALEPLYEKYAGMRFNEPSSVGSQEDLSDLVEVISEDELLKHLAGISLRKTILWEIGFAENLNICPKGLYIDKYNPEGLCFGGEEITTEYSKILGKINKKFPEMNAYRLQEGVLDYINTCLFSSYSSDTNLKKTDEGLGWNRLQKIKNKILPWAEHEKNYF